MNFIIRQHWIQLKSRLIKKNYTYCSEKMISFKSACSLENLYPKSNLNLYTPKLVPEDSSIKFNGFIPIKEIDITYSCSGGPGGQNVNKVNTKVDIRFNVMNASWLCQEVKQKIIKKFQSNINKDGYIIIKSDLTRSQQLNLADALQKLRKMIRDLIITPSQPSLFGQEKYRQRKIKSTQERVFAKRIKSDIKSHRQAICE